MRFEVIVPDTASYIRGWMQMVLTPNDLFSWNNKYSKYMVILLYTYILQWFHSPFSSHAHQLTLCMWVTLSREGVVFLLFLLSSHFTEIHVFPSPVSEANWRFLPRPGGLPPTPSNMASSFTGSAHPPFPGCDTVILFKVAEVSGALAIQIRVNQSAIRPPQSRTIALGAAYAI
jgi:hypothetical protein